MIVNGELSTFIHQLIIGGPHFVWWLITCQANREEAEDPKAPFKPWEATGLFDSLGKRKPMENHGIHALPMIYHHLLLIEVSAPCSFSDKTRLEYVYATSTLCAFSCFFFICGKEEKQHE